MPRRAPRTEPRAHVSSGPPSRPATLHEPRRPPTVRAGGLTLFNRKVEYIDMSATSLDDALYAVAHPSRRRIVERLMRGPARVTDLAAPFDMSLNGGSKHLKVLESAGLVRRTLEGREHRLSLRHQPIRRIQAWSSRFERFWTDKLEALAAQVEKEQETE